MNLQNQDLAMNEVETSNK